jgi:hypothetical protein
VPSPRLADETRRHVEPASPSSQDRPDRERMRAMPEITSWCPDPPWQFQIQVWKLL